MEILTFLFIVFLAGVFVAIVATILVATMVIFKPLKKKKKVTNDESAINLIKEYFKYY